MRRPFIALSILIISTQSLAQNQFTVNKLRPSYEDGIGNSYFAITKSYGRKEMIKISKDAKVAPSHSFRVGERLFFYDSVVKSVALCDQQMAGKFHCTDSEIIKSATTLNYNESEALRRLHNVIATKMRLEECRSKRLDNVKDPKGKAMFSSEEARRFEALYEALRQRQIPPGMTAGQLSLAQRQAMAYKTEEDFKQEVRKIVPRYNEKEYALTIEYWCSSSVEDMERHSLGEEFALLERKIPADRELANLRLKVLEAVRPLVSSGLSSRVDATF